MILERKPISMAESIKYVDKNSDLTEFIKKIKVLSEKDATSMRNDLEKLDILKMREENIVKIIDILPENEEEINKIFIDSNLDEDETNKILEIVKQFK
ncbi:MAG: hypothetical protein Q7S56_04005 [Nanoarchaeota archaeon]|nr:hypothetical protein [Nanoarchaeota archaeon]